MTPDVPVGQSQSAQIIPFPLGGRKSLTAARANTNSAEVRAPHMGAVAAGAWYHQAAIEEAACVRQR